MAKSKKTLPFDDLELIPPVTGSLDISENVQQTLSLLSGFDGVQRRLLKVSSGGVLFVAAPRVKDILNLLADQTTYNWQGDNIETCDVLIRAHPNNNDRVWVNIDEAAAPDTGYPLDGGEWVNWTVSNLKNLHVHIVTDTEKAIVVYSR